MELPRRKRELLVLLPEFFTRQGRYPTFQEITDTLGWKSRSTAAFHLAGLVRLGFVQKDSSGAICGVRQPARSLAMTTIPFPGMVPASPPREVFASEEVLEVPERFVSGKTGVFAIQVAGDSMIGQGIHDGDLAFIERRDTAEHGQVVAVRVNGETTLKLLDRSGPQPVFRAANPAVADIVPRPGDEVAIIGVLVGVFHRFG